MADAGDSKSPALTGVPVQVRGSVLGVKPYTAQACVPLIRGFGCYRNYEVFNSAYIITCRGKEKAAAVH